jgi:hypothetical protein
MFMKLAAKVQEWITHNEWSDKIAFDEENQTSSVSFIYIINEQPFKVWVETDENKDMVSVYIYAPFNALPNKLNDCSILFNHINNNTVWGGIACDENGSLVFNGLLEAAQRLYAAMYLRTALA